jgi:hypothetical protein
MEPPLVNFGNYPLKDIPTPHPHDVLCGRGGGTNNHVGNSHWRMLVAANKQLYVTLPKRQKMLLSRSIVNAVRSQNPPGRFLQKEAKSDLWYDVGDQRAQEKTSRALREGAPDIRLKITPRWRYWWFYAAQYGNEIGNSKFDKTFDFSSNPTIVTKPGDLDAWDPVCSCNNTRRSITATWINPCRDLCHATKWNARGADVPGDDDSPGRHGP